mmetsp:Transcript_25747/g.36911  ORF Transcript_25747/g.36911 Transcript_25747/m.36911 type:complete len:196 (-) Transcript_25747:335-922(-)
MKSAVKILILTISSFTFVSADSLLDAKKICQYGGFCRTDSDCVLGNKCIVQSIYYSQCIPDTSSYADVSTGCVAQYGPCSSTTTCCDPGAICASYNQCVQPQTPICVYPGGYSTEGESAQAATEVQLQVGAGLIEDLPEVLMEAPPSKLQIQRPNSGLSQSSSESASINGGSYSMPPDNNVCAGNNQIVSYCAFS